jgi:hypothetical protein
MDEVSMPVGSSQIAHDAPMERDCLDLHLCESFRIRLQGAGPADADAISRQLGLPLTHPQGKAAVTVEFSDGLDAGDMTLFGAGHVGFTNDEFRILRDSTGRSVDVSIPFEKLGRQTTLKVRRGVDHIPLLPNIVCFTALCRGFLPIHASSFRFQEQGVMVAGWCEGGKTEALLGFLDQGAQPIADDWTLLDPSLEKMIGLPLPVTLWDWHLTELPSIRHRLPRRTRAQQGALRGCDRFLDFVNRRRVPMPFGGLRRKLEGLVRRQRHVCLPMAQLSSTQTSPTPIDKLFLIENHSSSSTRIAPIDPHKVADRMVWALEQEMKPLREFYTMYRFAFPERSNQLFESTATIHNERLHKAFAGKEAYLITHPHPAPIGRIVSEMQAVLNHRSLD